MSARGSATIKVDFSNIPTRPPAAEVIDFVITKLGLHKEQLNRIHLRTSSTCAYVEVKDPNIALDIVDKHDCRHEIECHGKKYAIAISMDDGSTIVKIHDVSALVTNTDIAKYMSYYGEVVSVTEGVWSAAFPCAGLPNGFRYVRMVRKKPIPSFIHINGETTLVTHRGQQATCRKCNMAVHHGMTCVKNRMLIAQKSNVNDRLNTYASIAASNNSSAAIEAIPSTSKTLSAPLSQAKGISAASLTDRDTTQSHQSEKSEKVSTKRTQPDALVSVTANATKNTSPIRRTSKSESSTPTHSNGRERSTSAKRQAERLLTDTMTVESKRGRTRYLVKSSNADRGRKHASK